MLAWKPTGVEMYCSVLPCCTALQGQEMENACLERGCGKVVYGAAGILSEVQTDLHGIISSHDDGDKVDDSGYVNTNQY